MPTQTAKDPSAREKIIAVLKDWRVLAGEVLAVGGSFLVGWAPPGHVGGVSSWATGLATGATLVVLIALAGNWPSRPTKVCTTRLRLFVAALALATIGLTVCYGQLLGELVYTWPEPGSAAATAPQRYIRGDASPLLDGTNSTPMESPPQQRWTGPAASLWWTRRRCSGPCRPACLPPIASPTGTS